MELIALRRDVEAIQIPYGERVTLREGSEVAIHQVLGGNYTVQTYEGFLARIDGKDADALGKEPAAPPTTVEAGASLQGVVDQVWGQLRTCYDPEIPVDVVELGLVYEVKVEPLAGSRFSVDVKMTLTAPGCGMGPVLEQDALAKIRSIPGVEKADVEIVFEPPWDPSRMTEAARLHLGML